MNKVHELKTLQPYYSEVEKGLKNFELRFNDRDFRVGDVLVLRPWDPRKEKFGSGILIREVSYVMKDFKGLQDGYVILGLDTPKSLKAFEGNLCPSVWQEE